MGHRLVDQLEQDDSMVMARLRAPKDWRRTDSEASRPCKEVAISCYSTAILSSMASWTWSSALGQLVGQTSLLASVAAIRGTRPEYDLLKHPSNLGSPVCCVQHESYVYSRQIVEENGVCSVF